MDEHQVRTIEWPKERAQLDQSFNLEKPCLAEGAGHGKW